MKNILSLLILLLFVPVTIFAGDVYVKGYYRSDGTYVQPHYRSAPDGNPYNNYSSPGNINPYKNKSLSPSTGDVYVKGYYRSDGTYVKPHYRSAPDGNPYNNYSSPGNTSSYSSATIPSNKSSVRSFLKNTLRGYKSLYRSTQTNPYHTEDMRRIILADYEKRILEIQSQLDSLAPTNYSGSQSTSSENVGVIIVSFMALVMLAIVAAAGS